MNKDQKVLVTGGAGYIGSHIVLSCLDAGYGVVVIDRDEKACKHLQKCLSRRKKLKVFNADIENEIYLDGIFENENIGAIIHCAAETSVSESMSNPLKHYYNNTAKSIKLLERSKKYGVNRFIFSSSADVYGEPPSKIAESIPETQPCKPINPHGESKLMFETILKKYSSSNSNFKYTSLRYFNVAGNDIQNRVQDIKWRYKEEVVPMILARLIQGKGEFTVFGKDYNTPDGTFVRDYVHPTDLANAHLMVLKQEVTGVYNIGTNKGHTIWDLIKEAVNIVDAELSVLKGNRREGDPEILVANATKFMKKTGWEPSYSINDIMRTAYKAYLKVK